MSIRFIPVEEITEPLTLTIGLSGGSGTGKTYTALSLARGIAEEMTGQKGAPIGYVDTENRRALHYKTKFPEMRHYDFKATDEKGDVIGFPPERWIEVIDAAEQQNLPVVILDSFSHAWEGVGGVLDMHATVLDKLTGGNEALANKRSQLAWAQVKPRYRRLIDRIVRAKTNIIICTRAKPVMQDSRGQNARDTKTRRKDVPWDPATDADLMFEMTCMVILEPGKPGCPVHQIKMADQFKPLLRDRNKPMGAETGRAMAQWSKSQDSAQREKDIMDEARQVARQGRAAMREWWKANRDKAQIAGAILEELQSLADDADRDMSGPTDDPFADAAPSLTPEQQAEQDAAEAAYREGES